MKKVNLANRLIVDIDDLKAIVLHYDAKEQEHMLWVSYNKFAINIAYDSKAQRDTELKLLLSQIKSHYRDKQFPYYEVPNKVIIRKIHLIAANVEKSNIRLLTDLVYPYNRIFYHPTSVTEEMERISQAVGV